MIRIASIILFVILSIGLFYYRAYAVADPSPMRKWLTLICAVALIIAAIVQIAAYVARRKK